LKKTSVTMGVRRVLEIFARRRGFGAHDFHQKGRSPFIDRPRVS
jgi:hypothetical protein